MGEHINMLSVKTLIVLLVVMSTIIVCYYSTSYGQINTNTANDLIARKSMWTDHAYDSNQFPCIFYLPTKKKCYPDGSIDKAEDSVKFNALLCYSGNEFACDSVKRSQAPDGRWWRSPLHAMRQESDFSRDHVLAMVRSKIRRR